MRWSYVTSVAQGKCCCASRKMFDKCERPNEVPHAITQLVNSIYISTNALIQSHYNGNEREWDYNKFKKSQKKRNHSIQSTDCTEIQHRPLYSFQKCNRFTLYCEIQIGWFIRSSRSLRNSHHFLWPLWSHTISRNRTATSTPSLPSKTASTMLIRWRSRFVTRIHSHSLR